MKVLIFVEVDVVVRHFIHSHAFSELIEKHDVAFVFPEPGHKRMGTVNAANLDLGRARRLELPSYPRRLSLWRWLYFVDMIRSRPGIERRQLASMRRVFRAGNGLRNYTLYRVLGLPVVFQIFRSVVHELLKRCPHARLNEMIRDEKPDVLVHPCVLEGVYINDVVEVSQKSGIPLVVIMNSWDNPVSKRAVVGRDYWLLVWGPQTRNHAVQYMGMAPEHVVEFGAAQFDIYAERPRWRHEALMASYGIDPNIPVLLYAGSSKQADEFAHLQQIDRAISDGQLPRMAVIYRPHPWGDGGRDGRRFFSHPWRHVVLDKSMREYLERIQKYGRAPKYMADYSETRDLVAMVDAVVSPLSTILLEAMMLGKPPMCFLPVDEPDARHFRLAQGQVHFDDLFAIPELVVAAGGEQLIEGIRELMKKTSDPSLPVVLKERSRFFIRQFDEPFRTRIVPYLETVSCAGKCA